MKIEADDHAPRPGRFNNPDHPKRVRAVILIFIAIAVLAFFAVFIIAIDYQSMTNQNPVTIFKHTISGELISNINIVSAIIIIRGGYSIWKERRRRT